MKFFMYFINTIYWLWLVITPLIPISIFGFWLYDKSSENVPFIILLGILGLIIGIAWAEKTRKQQGLATFFSKIINSDDIDESEDKVE
jgi:hypothetical protein